MPIEMIATDIDGTFIRNDHTFDRDHFQRILQQLRDRHIRFVVASGNQLGHLTEMFDAEDNLSFLAENGGLVTVDQKPIFTATIDPELLAKALTLIQHDAKLTGGSIVLSGTNGAYVEEITNPTLLTAVHYFYTDLNVCDDLNNIDAPIFKMDLVWDDDLADHRAAYLNQRLPAELTATASGFGGLDIIPAHVNKEVGLQALERYWHIEPQNVMAFGDNDNDLAMLNHVGHGYAMANAARTIQAAAHHVTKWTNDEDGVLRTIETVLHLD